MNKEILLRIQALFEEKLKAKTGWGRNDVLAIYKDSVSEALMGALDEQSAAMPYPNEFPIWEANRVTKVPL